MDVTLGSITLGEAVWIDEWNWTAIEQGTTRTLGGRQVVEEGSKIGGQPLTLQLPQGIQKTVLDQLVAERDIPNNQLILTLEDGRQFTVGFRHDDTPLEVKPMIDYTEHQADDWFNVTIKLFIY